MSEPKQSGGSPRLDACKRYITTHDPKSGKSVYAESPDQVFNPIPNFGWMARSYAVGSVPADLRSEVDITAYRANEGPMSHKRREIVVTQPGAGLVVVDLEPGAVSTMHRTVSIDFSICCIGPIDHELDSGEKVRLYPGDHIVQRGTMHRWINPSKDRMARFVACGIPCLPFDVAGQSVKEQRKPRSQVSKL